jgi:hypothetical protein
MYDKLDSEDLAAYRKIEAAKQQLYQIGLRILDISKSLSNDNIDAKLAMLDAVDILNRSIRQLEKSNICMVPIQKPETD